MHAYGLVILSLISSLTERNTYIHSTLTNRKQFNKNYYFIIIFLVNVKNANAILIVYTRSSLERTMCMVDGLATQRNQHNLRSSIAPANRVTFTELKNNTVW